MTFPHLPSDNLDLPYMVEAVLVKKDLKILVKESRFQDQLRNRGFGEKEDSDYILKAYEALYLIHTKHLVLSTKKKNIEFDILVELALTQDKDILTKFLIYRDLRSRGYVVKEGFGFGIDFRIYERGQFEKKAAKYIIFGINEGITIESQVFFETIQQIAKMGKEPVVAVIERRGEVIYYKVSKVSFADNKYITK